MTASTYHLVPHPIRWLSALLLAGSLALLAGCGDGTPVKLDGVKVQTLDQQPVDLGSLKGKPAFVVFWATTCPGCVAEIPEVIKLDRKYADKGVRIIGIAMSYDELDQIKAMQKAKHIPYTLWQDKTGAAATAFGPVRLTPTAFVLDAKGNIRYQKIGAFDPKRVDALLDELSKK